LIGVRLMDGVLRRIMTAIAIKMIKTRNEREEERRTIFFLTLAHVDVGF
jgi:hypothetical protein